MADVVSIITPVYNAAHYLEETVRAVIAQSYPAWELVLVDDASTDSSLQLARALSKEDGRIRVHALPENGGAAVCRNKGIELSGGRFIAFCDADDIWNPAKLSLQIPFMKQKNAALSHTGFEIVDETVDTGTVAQDARIVLPPLAVDYRRMLISNYMQCSTVIYDAGRIGKQYFPPLRKRQDYALWLKLLRGVPCAYGLRENLLTYRKRHGSLSRPLYRNLHYNYLVFRQSEGFGPLRSAACVGCNVAAKLLELA